MFIFFVAFLAICRCTYYLFPLHLNYASVPVSDTVHVVTTLIEWTVENRLIFSAFAMQR